MDLFKATEPGTNRQAASSSQQPQPKQAQTRTWQLSKPPGLINRSNYAIEQHAEQSLAAAQYGMVKQLRKSTRHPNHLTGQQNLSE
jgi:hypothetical protein